MHAIRVTALAGMLLIASCVSRPEAVPEVSTLARETAAYAVDAYGDSAVGALGALVGFRTVATDVPFDPRSPAVTAMTSYLRDHAEAFGLDFADHGAVVVIGLGDARDRLGIVTHGDVQPADPTKWARDPFSLDTESEPGLLLGRGAEDDKGSIALAMYAMRALADRGVPLRRRIELVVSYTEESDWAPFQEFLAEWDAPDLNVALDSDYPVVTAEKGWGAIFLSSRAGEAASAPAPGEGGPGLVSFTGGQFLSQIPADAEARIVRPTPEVEAGLRAAADADTAVSYAFRVRGDTLLIAAAGVAAHSSTPWDGMNAITHLAGVLDAQRWPPNQVVGLMRLINDLVGTGDYADRFGDLAYRHEFMGPLTLSLTTLGWQDGVLVAGINIRRPVGRSAVEVEGAIRRAVSAWSDSAGVTVDVNTTIGDPHYLEDAPHIPTLLAVFRAYTGIQDAGPISIGGGTHARLLPNGVNFGPAMPGEPYSGHSEHEFITRDQFLLNLRMYAAMLVELAGRVENH